MSGDITVKTDETVPIEIQDSARQIEVSDSTTEVEISSPERSVNVEQTIQEIDIRAADTVGNKISVEDSDTFLGEVSVLNFNQGVTATFSNGTADIDVTFDPDKFDSDNFVDQIRDTDETLPLDESLVVAGKFKINDNAFKVNGELKVV